MGILEDIHVFLCVLEEGSFSAAGRKLDRTPSSVSKTIQRLEKRLNVSLFERIDGQIRATSEAEILKNKGQLAVRSIDKARESLASQKDRIAGLVRIHTALTTAKYLLAPLMPKLVAQYPQLEFDFVLDSQRSDFLEQEIDIAIHSGRPVEQTLIGRPLMFRPWVIAAAPAYLEQYGTPTTPADLANHKCLNFSVRTQWNSWTFNENNTIMSAEQTPFISANQGEFLRTLALYGMGIVRLAHFNLAEDLRQGRLIALLQNDTAQSHEDQFYLLYPKRKQTARAKAVIDFLHEHLNAATKAS